MAQIKEWLSKLFSASSDVSSMRVQSMIALFAAIGIAAYTLYKNAGTLDTSSSVTIGLFLGAAFGGNAINKNIETKAAVTSKALDGGNKNEG